MGSCWLLASSGWLTTAPGRNGKKIFENIADGKWQLAKANPKPGARFTAEDAE